MGDSWKKIIENGEKDISVNVDQALNRAKNNRGSIHYKEISDYYVVEGNGINIILNSLRRSEKNEWTADMFIFPEYKNKGEENHSSVHFGKNSEWVFHTHDFYELIYVLYGEIKQIFPYEELTLIEGEAILLDCNMIHTDRISAEAVVIFIQIPIVLMNDIMQESKLSTEMVLFLQWKEEQNKNRREYLRFTPQKMQQVDQVIDQLLLEQSSRPIGCNWIVRGLMMRLLAMLDNREKYTVQLFSENLSDIVSVFKELERYLAGRNWNIVKGELTSQFHYNERYLGQLIKRFTGMSMTKYCVEHKLGEAERLLRMTDLSINEIIGRIGYQNKTYFYNKFKEKYGITPLEFRQNMQSGY